MAGLNARIKINGLPSFWDDVALVSHVLVLLDYDGTLAPFHADRMRAYPLEGVVDALERMAELPDTTVALVSGRPVAEIQELTGLTDVIIAGTHGWEVYRPGVGVTATGLPPRTVATLDQAHRDAIRLVGRERAERKIATVALHVRGLDADTAQAATAAFRASATALAGRGPTFEVRDFNGGVELRVRHRNKGVAVREILEATPQAELVVYIGDDDTDEDAFRALPVLMGAGIKVGQAGHPTAALGRLDSCEDVLKFLTDWIATKTCQ